MTVATKTLIATGYAADSQTTVYTSPAGTHTKIEKHSATNNTASPVTYAVNIVPSGGSAAAGNLVYSASIAANTSVEITPVAGHTLNPGDFISTIAGTASALVIRASGKQITAS